MPVFDGQVQRVKILYSFSGRSSLRAILQRNTMVRGEIVARRRTGTVDGSLLYSYRVNWQTVLFAGYGRQRLLDDEITGTPRARSLFVKLSYALQR